MVLSLFPRGFSPGTPVFSSSQKPKQHNTSKFQSEQELYTKNRFVDVLPLNRYFLLTYLFVYLFEQRRSFQCLGYLLFFLTSKKLD